MSVWNPRMLCEGFIGLVSACTEGAGNLKVVIGKCIPCKIKMEIGRECRTYFHRFVRDWGHVFGSFVDRKKVKLDDSIHFTFSHDLLSWTPDYFCLKWKPHEPTWFFFLLNHATSLLHQIGQHLHRGQHLQLLRLQRTRLNLISTTSWDAKCLISCHEWITNYHSRQAHPACQLQKCVCFNLLTWSPGWAIFRATRMGAILLFPTVLAST